MSDDRTGVDLISDIQSGALDQQAAPDGGVQTQILPDNGQVQAPPGTLPAQLAGQEQQATPTIREALSSAFKQGAPGDQQQAAEPTPGALESNRRADGTFKSQAELDADKSKLDMQRLTQQSAAPAGQQQQQQAVQPPPGLTPAEITSFTALPAEMQQVVARTMASVGEQANSLRDLAALQSVITPDRVGAWAMNGMAPNQAISQLLALSDFATRDPAGFALQFCAQNGIDIGRLADNYIPPDPALLALQQQIGSLTQTVNQFQQGAASQQLNSTISVIEKFATATDAQGNLLRPHWNDLTAEIEPFIRAERAANPNRAPEEMLTAAYERACWGNPNVRAKMQAATEAARLAEQRGKTEAARAAAASVTGAPAATGGTANDNNGSRTIRDELRHQFSRYATAV